MTNKTCILFQTNDEYDFLWEGLYLSWKLNWMWDPFNFPVYVITETKDFKQCHPSCNFETINVGHDLSGAGNYSSKLLKGLDYLQGLGFENIIYCQDDSWPETSPDSLILNDIFRMFEEKQLDVFYFHEHRPHFPFTVKDTGEYIRGRRVREFYGMSRFYYNHGCSIWKISSLKQLQKEEEGPYQNEWSATERCWFSKPKAYILNYPWYDQDVVHENGVLKDSAHKIIKNLRFRFSWENKDNFMFNYIAEDGSIIPLAPDDPRWNTISEEERQSFYRTSHGNHFSTYL